MGKYYEQSGVTIYHGDCTAVLESVAPFCDHFITDPPYARDVYLRAAGPMTKTGSGTPARLGVPRGKSGIPMNHLKDGGSLAKLSAGDIGAVDELIEPVSKLLAVLTKRWGLVFSDVETCHRWRDALSRASMRYVRTGAWVKPDAMPQMSGDRPAVGFEPATIVHAAGPMRWNGGGRQAIWTHYISKGHARPDHPCPKPEPLMLELVSAFTDVGELILDPFMGSGTTLIAAKRLGRRAIGIELNERYCEIAARRLQQEALPLSLGAPLDAVYAVDPVGLIGQEDITRD
jgi:DNA modification methylase